MAAAQSPFGKQLFDELKRIGRGTLVTDRMKYDQIHRLKSSDRHECIHLFIGASYETIQHFKNDSPQELSQHLIQLADVEAQQNAKLGALFNLIDIAMEYGP